jgi:hypothetical protein
MNKSILIDSALKQEATINFIKSLNLDKKWRITIEPYKANRSTAQNSLYWMWVTIIGEDIGYSREELHVVMADKFLGYEEIKAMGKEYQVLKSTKTLNAKEFTEYLNKIERQASELGVVLPHPDDLYYEAMGIKRK